MTSRRVTGEESATIARPGRDDAAQAPEPGVVPLGVDHHQRVPHARPPQQAIGSRAVVGRVRGVKQVELVALTVEAESRAPLVLLREQDAPRRVLPIFVGPVEATAIALALGDESPPRPLTHDLMVALVGPHRPGSSGWR